MNRVFQTTTALYRAVPILFAAAFAPAVAFANPQDGVVVEGAATISHAANTLNVHQSSDRAVIDWRTFNIDVNEHTQFHQPSANSIALNRVRSNDPSIIAGRLSANGKVILVNPNGVFFSGTSRVDVNGLVVSTADIHNRDFMENRMNFREAGKADAVIRNDGQITASQAGLVGMVAPNVVNNGVIRARTVQLASGDRMALDFYGDGIMGVAVSDQVRSQLVKHTGTIEASGGVIELTAAAGRGVVDSLIEVRGELKAPAVTQRGGKIIIAAAGTGADHTRGHSRVIVDSALDVSGKSAGQSGGRIEISGDDIELGHQAVLDASGHSALDVSGVNRATESVDDAAYRTAGRAGGDIYIGGGYQGDGAVRGSQRTRVARGAQVNVRSTHEGDGGRAIIWSDGITGFDGHIDARGGDVSGSGGIIEVSGAQMLGYDGSVDASALTGNVGHFLLDPTNITISNAASSNVTGVSPYEANADDVASNLNTAALVTALGSANVTVRTRATGSQAGNITVVDPLSWSTNFGLTLDAHNDIIVNAAITARNALTFTAGGDVQLNANLIEQASGANLTFQTKTASNTIGIAGGAGTLNLSTTDLSRIQAGWNNITIGNSGGTGLMSVNAHTWNAPLTLRSTTGEIRIDGTQTLGTNAMNITTRNLTLNANLNSSGTGSLTIQPDNNSTTVGIGDGATGTLNLTNAELARMQAGWAGLIFGRTDSTADMNVNAYSWSRAVTLNSRTGLINIAGNQTMGNNNLTINSRNLTLNGNLSGGTGTLTIRPEGNGTVMNLTDTYAGSAGQLNLSTAELNRIQDGWGSRVFGLTSSTAALNIGAYVWQDNTTFNTSTGLMTISGTQTMGTNNLTIATRNLTLNGNLSSTGTGTLTIRPEGNGTIMNMTDSYAGSAGDLNLSTAELNRIQDGWSQVNMGLTSSTAALNIGAYTWNDNVGFLTDTGLITIGGAQNLGGNNLTIHSDTSPVINAALTGTGVLNIRPNDNVATTYSLATTGGNINLSVAMLNQISTGWGKIKFGTDVLTGTGAFTLGAYSWTSPVELYTDTGAITVSGAQAFGVNDFTITSRANVTFNAAVNGTGNLWFNPEANNTTVAVGTTGSNMNIVAASIPNIGTGWGEVLIGRLDGTGAMNFGGANIFGAHVRALSNTGAITIGAAQNFSGKSFTLETNANPVFNANLSSAGGTFWLKPLGNTAISLGSTAAAIDLTSAEIARLVDGWAGMVFGKDTLTANIGFGTATWQNKVTAKTSGNINLTGTITNTETSADAFKFSALSGGDIANTATFSLGGTSRWLMYAQNLSDVSLGALTQDFRRYGCTLAGGCVSGVSVPGTGNGVVIQVQPTATLSGIVAHNRVYDGTNIATFNTAGATFGGVNAGDVLTLDASGAVGTFGNKNVGTGKAVTASGFALSGVNIGYLLSQPTGLTANVIAKALNVLGLSGVNLVYDATTIAGLSGTAALDDVISGDTVSISGSGVGAFADKNVGTAKAISVSGFSLSGGDAANYTLSQPTGLTANVTKANLRVVAQDLTINAGETPVVSFVFSAADLQGSDTLGTIGLSGAPSVVGVSAIPGYSAGTYNLALDVSGLSATNYQFIEFTPRGVLTIDALPITTAEALLPASVLATPVQQAVNTQVTSNNATSSFPAMTVSSDAPVGKAHTTIVSIQIMEDVRGLFSSGLMTVDAGLGVELGMDPALESDQEI